MIKEFIENPNARKLHSRGLEQATPEEDLVGATTSYRDALEVIRIESKSILNYSRLMQESRIARDLGFVPVRQAAELVEVEDEGIAFPEEVRQYLEEAYTQLDSSRKGTALMGQLGPGAFSAEAWQFLESEHGFTIGLIGRCLTLSELLGISLTEKSSRVVYHTAWEHLETGSNHCYATSIAMKAARFSVFHGRHDEAVEWKDRSADAKVWARESGDEKMYEDADRTFCEGIPPLASKEEARLSILQNP